MFRASSCPSSGKWYKTDHAYGVQHWPCCSIIVEKRWFGVLSIQLVYPKLLVILRLFPHAL
jgi:hypothetical protein